MDYPSGRQIHPGASLTSARCRVDGGGPAGPSRTSLQMNSWNEQAYLLGAAWQSSLAPASSQSAPDRAHQRTNDAPPDLTAVSGEGCPTMTFSNPHGSSAWASSGQQSPNGDQGTLGVPVPRVPTTYQGQVNPATAGQFFHPSPQWSQTFSNAGLSQDAQSHHQPVDGAVPSPITSGPLTSAPTYGTLLAPARVPIQPPFFDDNSQPHQEGYYQVPSNSVFLIQSPPLNQWPVSGPSLSQALLPTVSAPDAGPLSGLVFNTTFDDRGSSQPSRLSSVDANALPPTPESHYPHSPASALSRRRGSTASTEITVPDGLPEPVLPTPVGQRRKSKAPAAPPLEFVMFKPENEVGPSGSRKRQAEDYPPGAAAETLREVKLEGRNGELQGAMTIFGRREKKRATFSDEKKKRVKIVRKAGVCDRCKKAKKGCDLALKLSPYEPCDLCGSTELYKGVQRMPCFQSKLEELLFFRSGPAENEPLYTNRSTIYKLGEISKNEALIKSVKLTQSIPGAPYLTVYASEFEPLPGDVLSYHWKDPEGKTHVMDMPRYSLTAIDKVKNHFFCYIETAKHFYLKSLEAEGGLPWLTVRAAAKYAQSRPGSLTQLALDLWAVCRMIEIPWTIYGEETLGIERVTDERNPHFGKIPIPPTMDTQLDQVVIKHVLVPLRDRLIEKFNKVIKPPTPEAWFDTYLASFMLLNHIEHLARHSVEHAKLHAVPGKYSNIPFLEGALHWAKIILSRFHFVCNGSAPLNMDWTTPQAVKMANLEEWQRRFMIATQSTVSAKKNDLLVLRKRHKYEDPLYWCHQLFSEEWDKSPAHVIEEEE
ncbi:hypothetical protein V8F20_012786 [Naviculisporaceae sp. PSN 640]